MKKKYCIECEEMVLVERGIEGHSKLDVVSDDDIHWHLEVDFCEGPFADCPPPPLGEFDLNEEPTPEELAVMDANGRLLMSYLE